MLELWFRQFIDQAPALSPAVPAAVATASSPLAAAREGRPSPVGVSAARAITEAM
jgi:hypothetical protein